MMKAYEATGDVWKATVYKKAIGRIKAHEEPIKSKEEAIKIPGIGKNIAAHIEEILETGELEKLDHVDKDVGVFSTFTNIWGCGPKTARQLYNKGYRTLGDLSKSDDLNRQQRIGLKYYEDFNTSIPREEVTALGEFVEKQAKELNSSAKLELCGSYRRGKKYCGDVDILMAVPHYETKEEYTAFFKKLISKLEDTGFVKDTLSMSDRGTTQLMYLGVCRGPNYKHHRRIDIVMVPASEWACALIYFTGSEFFGRSMRSLAKKERMLLSQHSLRKDVQRYYKKITNSGKRLDTPTEESVFEALGVPFVEPSKRDDLDINAALQ
ncbi:DNA polymerase lambda-like [Zophobas morio]|uniref:DNA polymerase lambda-like n=1 Tax=Zophobas morio TaxID=2755281 RepID=UPI0030835F29